MTVESSEQEDPETTKPEEEEKEIDSKEKKIIEKHPRVESPEGDQTIKEGFTVEDVSPEELKKEEEETKQREEKEKALQGKTLLDMKEISFCRSGGKTLLIIPRSEEWDCEELTIDDVEDLKDEYPVPVDSFYYKEDVEKIKAPKHYIKFGIGPHFLRLHPNADSGKYKNADGGGGKLQYTYTLKENLRVGLAIFGGELNNEINGNENDKNEMNSLSLLASQNYFNTWFSLLFGRTEIQFEHWQNGYSRVRYAGLLLGAMAEKEWHIWWKLNFIGHVSFEHHRWKVQDSVNFDPSSQNELTAERLSIGGSLGIYF